MTAGGSAALAVLDEARDLVESIEGSTGGTAGPEERERLRASYRALNGVLRDGRIGDSTVLLDAADVLRRGLLLDLTSLKGGGTREGQRRRRSGLSIASRPGIRPPGQVPPDGQGDRTSQRPASRPVVGTATGSDTGPSPVEDLPHHPEARPLLVRPDPRPLLVPLEPAPLVVLAEPQPLIVRPEPRPLEAKSETRLLEQGLWPAPDPRTPSASEADRRSLEAAAVAPIRVVPVRDRPVFIALRVIGTVLVLFVGYALFVTAAREGQSQRGLDHSTSLLRVSAPVIGLDDVVVRGDSRGALAKGPGLVSGAPTSTAPILIVGHRTTFGAPFGHLSALRPDDQITLRTATGTTYTYEVTRVITTSPRAKLVDPTGASVLYLVTASPAYDDHGRLVVEAQRVGAGSRVGAATTVQLPALTGSPDDAVLAVLVLGLLVSGWIVRTRSRMRLPAWGRWATWPVVGLVSLLCWHLLLGSMSRLL